MYIWIYHILSYMYVHTAAEGRAAVRSETRIHTHIQTYMHTNIHTNIHTSIDIYIKTLMYVYSHTSQPTQPQPPPPPPLDFACQHTLPLDHHTSCMPGVVTSRPRDTIVTFPVHVLTVTGSDTPPAARTSVVTLVPRTARPRCSC